MLFGSKVALMLRITSTPALPFSPVHIPPIVRIRFYTPEEIIRANERQTQSNGDDGYFSVEIKILTNGRFR